MNPSQGEGRGVVPRLFTSSRELDAAIAKIRRRIVAVDGLQEGHAVMQQSRAETVVASGVRETIRDIFGTNSPEFAEHEHIRLWGGPESVDMQHVELIAGIRLGKVQVKKVLEGLIDRLEEKRDDLDSIQIPSPSDYFSQLNLHPRISEVSSELFLDGYHWEAVFACAKSLVNYVKERSDRHDLDGTPLVRCVFSKNNPILAFNSLSEPKDFDEQEGMMHLFEGAVMAIRNPGGHAFPEGSEQRALEYISLLSLLAYRVKEARRVSSK